jgi:hypothetical protein
MLINFYVFFVKEKMDLLITIIIIPIIFINNLSNFFKKRKGFLNRNPFLFNEITKAKLILILNG